VPLPALPAIMPEGPYQMTIKGAGFLLDGKLFDMPSELGGCLFVQPTKTR
jgi:hypothetical protein